MKQIAHFISLDTIGGVETLFGALINNFNPPSISHNLVLYSGYTHPFLHQLLSDNVRTIHRIKHLGWIKLPRKPKAIRIWNHRRILQRLSADIHLFWNSINDSDYLRSDSYEKDSNFLFYDHGTSWYRKVSPQSRLFLANVTKTICCSHASKRVLELNHRHGGSKKVVHNPVRPDFMLSDCPVKALKPENPLKIGVAGRLVNAKGIGLALHTIAELKRRHVPAELHIAGTGPLLSLLRDTARRLDIWSQVHFNGLVKDMAAFFEANDIFLCPSIHEPFGIVAAEAMAKGCPVICSRVDGLPEVITHEKSGLCVPANLTLRDYPDLGGSHKGLPSFIYDPEEDDLLRPGIVDPSMVADSIQWVVADQSRYQRMSRFCIEDTRRRFGLERYITELRQVLENM